MKIPIIISNIIFPVYYFSQNQTGCRIKKGGQSESGRDAPDSVNVKLNDLFVKISKGEKMSYYKYQGSLSTPPYSESVNWTIANKIIEASEEQISRIEKLEGNNARHVHALNNRKMEIE
jgi:carbonic anhydrase